MVKLITSEGEHSIAGTVLQKNIPSIVQIDGYMLNFSPEKRFIITFHNDQPGIVAQSSKILWDKKINISGMSLGRTKGSNDVVMIVGVDDPVDDDSLQKIQAIQGIDIARYVQLIKI